jgi:large subunit ribosomal protein L32
MIWPKKKISIAKKHSRNATWQRLLLNKLQNMTNIVKCNNCGKVKLSHRVCQECGYYKGKQIITIKAKSKNTVIEA